MIKRLMALAMAILMLAAMAAGCGETAAEPETAPQTEPEVAPETETVPEPEAETELPADPVTITVAGGWEDCKALEAVAREFNALYPNCTIVYEYVQDYYNLLPKRMTGDEPIDIFFTTNIQEGNELLSYAEDLMSRDDLDLSNTFDGLISNFMFKEEGAEPTKLYAIPLGAEMRGLYVNKTLLDSLGIAMPTDQESLLAACETLKQNGYIAFHGNPGDFAQKLLYPWVCNIIANSEDPVAAFNAVEARGEGLSEMFREPMAFMYTLIENGYYDYKKAQTDLNLFTETTDVAYSRDFLNIRADGESWVKADDVGQVAFLPSSMSTQSVMEKVKEDYHSEIEYVFMPAPVGPDGGFAYMSPAHGIAVNKNSANLGWSIKFMDFLFTQQANELFSSEFNIIPNTTAAFDYVGTLYDIPADRISHLGQVTFSYGFYNILSDALLATAKANNPKYMIENTDGTYSLYPLDHYMAELETALIGNE